MLMDDLYNGTPYSAFTQIIPSSYTAATGADSSTINANIAVTNYNGNYQTCTQGSSSTSVGILNLALNNVTHIGKNTNIFFLQSNNQPRTGSLSNCIYSGSSYTNRQYCAALRIPDFIIGQYARKFFYLQAVQKIGYKIYTENAASCFITTSN